MRLTVTIEVCPGCLRPVHVCETLRPREVLLVTRGRLDCPVCGGPDGWDSCELECELRGRWSPPMRATWSEWDGGDPGDPGGWEGELVSAVRLMSGGRRVVVLSELPDATLDEIDRLAAEQAGQDAIDEAECMDEMRAEARRDREDW